MLKQVKKKSEARRLYNGFRGRLPFQKSLILVISKHEAREGIREEETEGEDGEKQKEGKRVKGSLDVSFP